MKILFDAFPLGLEAYHAGHKTGVYRVVEELASNLVRAAADPAADLEVTFHATQEPFAARRFFRLRLQGPGSHFVTSRWDLISGELLHAVWQFRSRTALDRRLVLRALRWASTRGGNAVAKVSGRLSRRSLNEADIYHSPFLPIPAAVYRHSRLRRFTTVYDLIPITHPQFFEPWPIKVLQKVVAGFRPDDFVTCISNATRVQLLELAPQLSPERVFVTHLAAGEWCRREKDPERIAQARAAIGVGQDTPYFMSLCTLEPRKNLEMVIRAFARLREQGQVSPECRLVLVGGSGWKTSKIVTALEEAGHCAEAVVLTGFVSDEHLPALYTGALAFVYVSRLEGFGLPPLEAMQCGAPVITSNSSSLPEVVGDAGLTVDPDDIDGLCAHMLRLSGDEALRQELSARSLVRARTFSWERFGAETLAAYRTAMSVA
jgi:glycosyltransferase involved in cell wall biosynthesis